MKLMLSTAYCLLAPLSYLCLLFGSWNKCSKLVDEMYKLQVLMMHNSLRKESGNDIAARDISMIVELMPNCR